MTIHAQEGKSYADCLKQSWNTSRILTQEKTRPSQPTKSANKEATSNLPIGELVNNVTQLVEVGLVEFDPVKAITAAKKMRANVAEIFGELVKHPPKNKLRLSLLTSQRLGLDQRAKTLGALRAKVLSHRLHHAHHRKITLQTQNQSHPHLAGRDNGHRAMRIRSLLATNKLLCSRQMLSQTSVTRSQTLTFPC
jgi:hypothetical protein